MVYGVKIINGVIFVSNYKHITDVPKDENAKYPHELQDYIEEILRKKG